VLAGVEKHGAAIDSAVSPPHFQTDLLQLLVEKWTAGGQRVDRIRKCGADQLVESGPAEADHPCHFGDCDGGFHLVNHSTILSQKSDDVGSEIGQVFPPESREVSSGLLILSNEPCPHQKWLDYVTDGLCWQPEHRRQDVQPYRPIAEDGEIFLLRRPEPQVVDLLKLAGSLQMGGGDRILALAPAATPTCGQ
jgi:hypothetical protein